MEKDNSEKECIRTIILLHAEPAKTQAQAHKSISNSHYNKESNIRNDFITTYISC